MLISVENQTNFNPPLNKLEMIAQELTTREIELIIIDSATIQELNAIHRAKDSATDVLSFPLDGDFEGLPLGSIVICDQFIYDKAKVLGHSEDDECILLFIHGLLHLLGFDHERDKGEMRDEEERLIDRFSLPKSLIVRTQI